MLYPLIAGWERWARAHASGDLAELVRERERAALLERDLQTLGRDLPAAPPFPASAVPGLSGGDAASFLGALYVVEGSRLGGQYIARHVEPLLRLSAEEGTAYFRGHGERTGPLWRAVLEQIRAVPERDGERVIAAARGMFGVFAKALHGDAANARG